MRLPRFRVRTLLIIVGVMALVIRGAMMGSVSYEYHRRSKEYDANAHGWRQIAARGRWDAKFASECSEYYTQLARKYRRAMWRPWLPIEPDPHAPGYDRWIEQERRAKEVASDVQPPGNP